MNRVADCAINTTTFRECLCQLPEFNLRLVQESASTRFRQRLRELRKRRNWTQERTAEACGIGYKLYQLYELGIKTNPGLLTLEKIARGFDLDISELLARRLRKEARTEKRKINAVIAPKAERKTRKHNRRG